MTGIVAHTYPEWWLKLAGQVAHWSTDYSAAELTEEQFNYLMLGLNPLDPKIKDVNPSKIY